MMSTCDKTNNKKAAMDLHTSAPAGLEPAASDAAAAAESVIVPGLDEGIEATVFLLFSLLVTFNSDLFAVCVCVCACDVFCSLNLQWGFL